MNRGLIQNHQVVVLRDKYGAPKSAVPRSSWGNKKVIVFLVTVGVVLILSVSKVVEQAATITRLQEHIRYCQLSRPLQHNVNGVIVLQEGGVLTGAATETPPGNQSAITVNTGEKDKTANVQVIAGDISQANNDVHVRDTHDAPPGSPTCRPIPPVELRMCNPPVPITALATFPGSGNTWTRHLIQQLSGYHTGSVYLDLDLRDGGFPGEYIMDGRVIVVKTHLMGAEHRANRAFNGAILIIRRPWDALVSEYNRRMKGHTGVAEEDKFGPEWQVYLNTELPRWLSFHQDWLSFPGKKLVVFYEEMRTDLRATLRQFCEFLDVQQDCTEERIDCVVRNAAGNFKRESNGRDNKPLFSAEQMTALLQHKDIVYRQLEKCVREGDCVRYMTLWPLGIF